MTGHSENPCESSVKVSTGEYFLCHAILLPFLLLRLIASIATEYSVLRMFFAYFLPIAPLVLLQLFICCLNRQEIFLISYHLALERVKDLSINVRA